MAYYMLTYMLALASTSHALTMQSPPPAAMGKVPKSSYALPVQPQTPWRTQNIAFAPKDAMPDPLKAGSKQERPTSSFSITEEAMKLALRAFETVAVDSNGMVNKEEFLKALGGVGRARGNALLQSTADAMKRDRPQNRQVASPFGVDDEIERDRIERARKRTKLTTNTKLERKDGSSSGTGRTACTSLTNSTADLNTCASRSDCFPSHVPSFTYNDTDGNSQTQTVTPCMPAEQVDCLITDNDKKMLFLSDGLSEKDTFHALRQLVLNLPNSAWINSDGTANPSLGAAKKAAALQRNPATLAAQSVPFYEPDLYSHIKAVVLRDACFFKQFEQNPYPCEDFRSVLVSIGFDANKVIGTSIFDDLNAGDDLPGAGVSNSGWPAISSTMATTKTALMNTLNTLGLASGSSASAISSIKADLLSYRNTYYTNNNAPYKNYWSQLLNGGGSYQAHVAPTSLIAVCGGDPDIVNFMITTFLPEVTNAIQTKVADGSMIYMGRSAGAMCGSKDVALTTEPMPSLTDNLLGCESSGTMKNTEGLGLAGKCVIRPHYSKAKWDIPSEIYERAKGVNVVRIPNGEGMMCLGTNCKMVGMAHVNAWDGLNLVGSSYTDPDNHVPHSQGSSALSFLRRTCSSGSLSSGSVLQKSAGVAEGQ